MHTRRVPVWVILGGSVLLFVAGAAALTLVGTEENIGTIVVPFLLLGLGFGLGVGLVDGQAIGSVPADKSGMVSGLVSTVRLGSEAVVVAVFASALTSGVGGQVRDRLPAALGPGERESIVDKVFTGEIGGIDSSVDTGLLRAAFADGFTPLLWVLAALSLVLAVAVILLLRRPVDTPTTPTAAAPVLDADTALDPEEIQQ